MDKAPTTLRKKHLIFIPILIITILTIAEVCMFKAFPALDYDEIVVFNISKQPWDVFVKSISSEPHPIGFYLILKLISWRGNFLTRTILLVLGNSLMALSLLIGNKYKVWERNKLYPGICLFIASYAFFTCTTRVKQDVLTTPLLFLFLTLYLIFKDTKNTTALSFMTLTTVVMMLLGLRPFINSLVIWIYELTLQTKAKRNAESNTLRQIHICLLVIGLFFVTYMGAFGISQVVNNLDRMVWVKNFDNNFSRIITQVYLPFKGASRYSEVSFALLLTLIIKELKGIKEGKIKGTEKDILVITIATLILGYITQSYVNIRYSIFMLLLFNLLISKYLYKINLNIVSFITLSYLILTIVLATIYFTDLNNNNTALKEYLKRYASINNDGMLWLTDGYPMSSIYLSTYPELSNRIHAIHLDDDYYIDYDVLTLERNRNKSYWKDIGKENIMSLLENQFKSGYRRVLYATNKPKTSSYMRTDLLKYLEEKCTLKKIEDLEKFAWMFIYYEGCNPNVPAIQ